MKSTRILSLISILFITVILSGCAPIHTLVFWRPIDIIKFPMIYIFLAFLFAKILQFSDKENRPFKYHFIRNLLLTPVYGFVKILMKLA